MSNKTIEIGDLGDPKVKTSNLSSSDLSRSAPIHYEEVLSTAAARLAVSSPILQKAMIDDEVNSNTSSHPNHRPPSLASSAFEESVLLSSLPQRPVANFPSESDRKRVLGCLAAIISMMYDYENWDEKEMNHSVSKDGLEDHDAFDESVLSSGEDFECSFEWEGKESTRSTENQRDMQINNSDSLSRENSQRKRSNRFGKKRRSTKEESNNNDEKPGKETSGNHWKNGGGTSGGSGISATTSNRTHRRYMIRTYKRRRHSVYKEFLTSAAGLLLLEKGNAIAFLPLLNSLLSKRDSEVSDASVFGTEKHMLRTSGLENEGENSFESLGSGCYKKPLQEEYDSKPRTWDNNELLCPFAESITPGAGLQCLSLLLVNCLLGNTKGYDARIRHVVKKLGVILFVQELNQSDGNDELESELTRDKKIGHVSRDDILVERATRQFEALERAIASKLLWMSALQQEQVHTEKKASNKATKPRSPTRRDTIMRSLKIGSVGVAAGTLFAVTGGLAAPGIAAGLAASGFTAATTGLVTTLTSTAAVTTIFGVGGGGLAAYKTHRRIKGLTDFSFQRENGNGMTGSKDKTDSDAELFTTICISGWLKDTRDFQRPWGVEPTNPPLERLERLMRFYNVFKPENFSRSQEILKTWEGSERQLWSILKEKYGRDPDHVLPIPQNPWRRSMLTHEEDEVVNNLLIELGYPIVAREQQYMHQNCFYDENVSINEIGNNIDDFSGTCTEVYHDTSVLGESEAQGVKKGSENDNGSESDQKNKSTKNALVLWDYEAEYGGELYTIQWETDLLMELCDSVTDLAVDVVGNAAREILKQTALSTLISAIAWPYGLVRAANMIDGTWTLAIERADLAGIELARSLLESQAGHRPVTLVGFSMGARTIYSCLKELARHQELWEKQQHASRSKIEKRYIHGKSRSRSKKEEDEINYSREPASIVEDAILMGTPNHLSISSWEACRCVVAGRLINCYSSTDLILSLMFQIKRLAGALRPVCGVSPVNVHGVENYDVSPFISAHSDYCLMTGQILRLIRHGQPYRPSSTIVVPNEFSEEESSNS